MFQSCVCAAVCCRETALKLTGLFDVQSALAHADSSIAERYAHLSEDTRQKTSYNISTVITRAINGTQV